MVCSGVQAAIRYTLNINAQNMSLLGKQELCGAFPWQRGASTVGMQQRCSRTNAKGPRTFPVFLRHIFVAVCSYETESKLSCLYLYEA